MSPSKVKYKVAVQAARDFAAGKLLAMPAMFDERQTRIFNINVGKEKARLDFYRELMDDMYLAYTGKTADEYHKGETK